MFYEEKWIDGKLYYRTTPDGAWFLADPWEKIQCLQLSLEGCHKQLKAYERQATVYRKLVENLKGIITCLAEVGKF